MIQFITQNQTALQTKQRFILFSFSQIKKTVVSFIYRLVNRPTLLTSDGILSAFVANPIPNAIASSVPRYSASKVSSLRCCVNVPETS